jgi:hypothetical protein
MTTALLNNIRFLINFDEASGPAKNEVQDLRVVTLEGTAARAAGKYGNALQTLAAADRATCNDGLNLRADPVSISAWIRFSKLPSAMWGSYPKFIAGYGTAATGGYFLGCRSGDYVSFYVVDAALSVYEAKFLLTSGDLDTWIHVCGVHTPTAVTIYKNGVSANSAVATGTLKYLPGSTLIMGENFEGLIDEVAIFGDSLSGAEVAAITAAKIPTAASDSGIDGATDMPYLFSLGREGGQVLDRPNELDQLRIPFDDATAEDVGPFNHHGTIIGSPSFVARDTGQALVLTNPAGLVNATQYVTFPACPPLTPDLNVALRLSLKTSDAAGQNGRLFATDAFNNADTESGISLTYAPTLTCRISDGVNHVDLAGPAVADGTWKNIELFIDRLHQVALLSVNGYLVASASISAMGTISLASPILGATAIPGSSFGSLSARGAIATVDDLLLVTVEALEAIPDTAGFPVNAFDSGAPDAAGAGDMASAAVPLMLPRDPLPRWSSLSLEPDRTVNAAVLHDITDLLAVTSYWEVEISAPRAYLRIDAVYNGPNLTEDDTEVAMSFPYLSRLNLAGLRIRYVIERYSDKTIWWATEWQRIPGGSDDGGDPGPEPAGGYDALVIVHIYDYVDGEPYTVKRIPDVVDTVGSGVDYTWNQVTMKDLDSAPALVDEKAGQLILSTIYPGRFRYRITAQWPGGDTYSQDFLLLVWPKPGEEN